MKQAEKGLSPSHLTLSEITILRPKIPLWQSVSGAKFVVRDFRDWRGVWDQTAVSRLSNSEPFEPGPKVLPPDFSFDQNIILIVFGLSNAGEQSLEIVSAREKGNAVQVEVVENTCLPPLNSGSVTAIYSIGDAVAIKKTEKEIIFKFVETNQCPHPTLKQNMIRTN
jgi:hypothetical protein